MNKEFEKNINFGICLGQRRRRKSEHERRKEVNSTVVRR